MTVFELQLLLNFQIYLIVATKQLSLISHVQVYRLEENSVTRDKQPLSHVASQSYSDLYKPAASYYKL